MKTKKIMLVCSAALIMTALVFTIYAQNSGKGTNALVGSWKVRLTPPAPQPQFDELITFTPGGGIVESNNFPFYTMGLTAGPGHGTWAYEGRQNYSFTFIKFLSTQTGQAAGTLKVTGTITYSPSTTTWSGPAAVLICDDQANNCVPIGTTEGQGVRIAAGS